MAVNLTELIGSVPNRDTVRRLIISDSWMLMWEVTGDEQLI